MPLSSAAPVLPLRTAVRLCRQGLTLGWLVAALAALAAGRDCWVAPASFSADAGAAAASAAPIPSATASPAKLTFTRV
jgi:hypothetical protein